MKGLKRGISVVLASALILTALPVNGVSQVSAEGNAVDATVKMIPSEASTFNDTNSDGLGEFQGWGTSLCWWANRLGYSEKLTSEAAAKFYGEDGLKMNIGRYNVGGGDDVYEMEEITPNEKAVVYGLEGDTAPQYTGTSMDAKPNTKFQSATYAVSDADFGFTAGKAVDSFKEIGWINELGVTSEDGKSSNLNYTVSVEDTGKYTIKMLCTLDGVNKRAMAIRVKPIVSGDNESIQHKDIVVNAADINQNVVASGDNYKMYLVTFSDVDLTAGANAIAIGGNKAASVDASDAWGMNFVKMLVVKSGEEGKLPKEPEGEFKHPSHIQRSDSAIPGYCVDVTKITDSTDTTQFARVDETSGYAWNYDWTADKNQLAILSAAMDASGEEFIAEAFSNSPPYFMTNSGCSSGAENSSNDNLRSDCYKAFAAYMADVIVHWAEVGFVDFMSATPMNEPYTSYWGANSAKQEGCHFDQGESQSKIITEFNAELQRQLAATTNEKVKKALSNLVICGTDETSIDVAITSYNKLSTEAKNAIQRIDTHTYGGSKRAELRALAEKEGKNLWMSEIDVGKTSGTNAGEMGGALNFAQRIITDLNGLKASAWIMWNAIDVHIDSDEERRSEKFDAKESVEEMKKMTYDDGTIMYDPAKYGWWGIAIADHNKEELILTRKYYAYGQFSRYIRPGYTIMGTSDEANTLIAYDPQGKKTVIVAMNTSDSQKTWKFDLSKLKTMGSNVRAYRTSGDTDTGEKWADVTSSISLEADTTGKSVTVDLLANSITTLVVEGTEYDPETNYEGAEKDIENQILSETIKENEFVMKANMDNVEEVALNKDMVTGSAPYQNSTTNVATNVVDNNFSTFFDGVENGWVQLDLGTQENIAGFGYAPRSGFKGRCVGASFYGSNDGQNWTKLYTISDQPSENVLTKVYASKFDVPNNTSYRYIKYAVPEGDSRAACNISELAVYRWKSGANVTFKNPKAPDDLQGWVTYYKSQIEGNIYFKEGWETFQTAMAAAENLLSSVSPDADEVSKARRSLALAYQGLVQDTETEPAKAMLRDAIAQNTVADSEKNQYTQSSWDNYQNKLTAAKNLLDEETLTEAQAKQAVSELESAKNALELKAKQKSDQTITCTTNYTKTYGDKPFKLNAKIRIGDGTLSYSSSDKKVADYNKKTGKIEIKGTGICTITITASETANYKKSTAKTTITVKPKKAALKTLKPGKKQLKVTWSKDSQATGYEIQCCLNKKFKSGVKKVTIKKANTTSTTIKKLKKGKRYCVRIRAYKTVKVNGKTTTLTGAWSKVKTSGKVK